MHPSHYIRREVSMVVDFAQLDLRDRPVLILKNTAGSPIGLLGSARNVSLDIKYNETSVVEFDIPANVDGVDTPFYNSVIGMRIVDVQNVGQFILINPSETSDGVKKAKSCKGYSLEYEFTFKKITLESNTYNFWNPVAPEGTLLGIILELMPSWKVGYVDPSLIGRYRTFDVSDENLYNFIKGTVQNSYSCIFDFDTYTREVNVREASSVVPTNPVFISNDNLAKEISVDEDTENIVTRLDVNGADGVSIRDVNPSGTNTIIDLGYFMTLDNFDQGVIDKYNAWKSRYENYQLPYYNLTVEYALQVMRSVTEKAALTELESQMTVLENEQAVIVQGIAQNLKTQADLDAVNSKISAKKAEIDAQNTTIASVEERAASIYNELITINKAVNFKRAFTNAEYLLLDRYIKDDSVSESSFVTEATSSYEDGNIGMTVDGKTVAIAGATITYVKHAQDKDIYDVVGGSVTSSVFSAEVIRAAFERASDGSFIMTAYLGKGTSGDRDFPKGCVSITGTTSSVSADMSANTTTGVQEGTRLAITVKTGYMYFTMDTSEYEKRAVAWDLLAYGKEVLAKLSQPSYKFSVTSANFLCLEDFESFKNHLRHGEKIYVALDENKTLSPILIGAKFSFDDMSALELEFGDTYTSGDSSFLLADLLEQSVSMGKSVDLNKYNYSSFMSSGASTRVKEFIDSALDVSKNAIISSKNQAISWGDSGIRLRKWANDAHTTYDPKQIWMNNNSILMTANNWSSAEVAIGNFHDDNLGDCWGIVAPNIVGTLLAGKNLVIESEKADGGVAVFKVDAEGCVLHNSTMSITSENTKSHILLDPEHGLMIGKYPLINNKGEIDDTKKLFYADTEGNLTLKGIIEATGGVFHGKIEAIEGFIGDKSSGWTIGATSIYNGKAAFSNTTQGIYIGSDGISIGSADKYVRANKNGYLLANNVNLTGTITAKSGFIGDGVKGWTIGSTAIYNGKPSLSDEASGIYIGVDGISIRRGGNYIRLSGDDGSLTANNATITGTINATGGSIGGCSIKDGKLEVSSAHIYGTIVADAINLNTASITGKLTAFNIDATDLHVKGANIDELVVKNAQIESLDCKKLNGYIPSARISDEDNYLSSLYVRKLETDEQWAHKINIGASLSGYIAYMDTTGLHGKGGTATWEQIITMCSGSVQTTAVFG